MDKKNPKSARGRIKDIYGNEVADNISFDEYWERQHLLEKYSYEESVRQKKERMRQQELIRMFDEASKCTNHTEQKLKDGECCQTKTKKK